MTGHPGSTMPTLPRKELRKYYGLGRVSALPAHAFRGPTPAVTVARIWWGRLWRIGVRFLIDLAVLTAECAEAAEGDAADCSGFCVVLWLSVSFSFGGGAGVIQVFAQFQAGLARFQGGFFREPCPAASSISMLRQSRVPIWLPEQQGRCGG